MSLVHHEQLVMPADRVRALLLVVCRLQGGFMGSVPWHDIAPVVLAYASQRAPNYSLLDTARALKVAASPSSVFSRMSVDPAGNLLLPCSGKPENIAVLSFLTGALKRTIPLPPGAGQCNAICCLKDGSVLAATGTCVHVLSAEDGAVLRSFAVPVEPRAMCVDERRGELYIAGNGMAACVTLGSETLVLWRFAEPEVQFRGIALVPAGVAVVDNTKYRVVLLDPDTGETLRTVEGGFEYPQDATSDFEGNLLVSGGAKHLLHVLDRSLRQVHTLRVKGWLWGIAVHPLGRLAVMDESGVQILSEELPLPLPPPPAVPDDNEQMEIEDEEDPKGTR